MSIMRTVAATNGCAFMNYGLRVPPHDSDTLSLFYDFTHLNKYGQAIEAEALAGFVSPR